MPGGATFNVDIKLSFEFDMTPGAEGRKFRRNLVLHGGKADAHGFSIADTFLRIDSHAVQNGQPIALPPPAGTLAAPGVAVAPAAGQLLDIEAAATREAQGVLSISCRTHQR